jgi:hypothetical protein
MSFKSRTLLLGLLACVLMGSVAADAAYAEAGPFFLTRGVGSEGSGEKLSETNPGEVYGEGGEQALKSTIAGTAIEITAKSAQDKGIIYNNALQGQVKILAAYSGLKLAKPELKECTPKMGSKNEIKTEGHLAWKWNGEKSQLEESSPKVQKPGIIFTSAPIAEGQTKLSEGRFTEVILSGSGCGVLAGTFPVTGSLSMTIKPANVGEWTTGLGSAAPGSKQVHFWNAKEFVGAEAGLSALGSPTIISEEDKVKIKVKVKGLAEEDELSLLT